MTAKLEEELARTKRKLEELEAEYQEYAYVVSHDFNAPLRQIDGFSKLILKNYKGEIDEKSQQYFDFLSNGAERCHLMLESLLEFSRLNAVALPFEEVDVKEALVEAEAHLTELSQGSGAKIKYTNLPVVKAQRKKLIQLFYYIIENALKYQKPEVSPEISIDVEETEHEWKFSIKDNGIGIPEKQLGKVFQVFYSGVDPEIFDGRGMGLAFAKKIVHLHGGLIDIESQEGEGTTVNFTIQKGLGD